MGVFKSTKTYNASPAILKDVVREVCESLRKEEYEVNSHELLSGGYDISITKGGLFKAIIGLKTALKVNIVPNGNESFTAEACVGIFGQQAIPTAITMLVAWPVLIPQIWGLIQQSQLDEHVLDLIQIAVNNNFNDYQINRGETLYCPNCGHIVTLVMKFCGECGGKL